MKFMRSAIATTKRLGVSVQQNTHSSPPSTVSTTSTTKTNASHTAFPQAISSVETLVNHNFGPEQAVSILKNTEAAILKVAFAITITRDGSVIDGSCVLAYSIIKTHMKSDVDVSFIAFVHPTATKSVEPLKRFGYQ